MNKLSSKGRRRFLRFAIISATMVFCRNLFASGKCTLSAHQTVGPFPPKAALKRFHDRVNPGALVEITAVDEDLTSRANSAQQAEGQIIEIHGIVQDQHCRPVSDAQIFVWQADNNGHYNHKSDTSLTGAKLLDKNFQYSATLKTKTNGQFSLRTIVPKGYQTAPGRFRTPHIHFLIKLEGYERLITQSYFEGEVLNDISNIRNLNLKDEILSSQGKTKPELAPLIVHFSATANRPHPQGELTLTIKKLSWIQHVINSILYVSDS